MTVAQIIENGVVINAVVVDPTSVVSADGSKLTWPGGEFDAPEGTIFIMQDGAGIGWTLEGGVLASPPAPVVAPAAPDVVTDLQFRLALNAAGLRAAAEAYIAGASQDVKDWWDRATHIRRDDPILLVAVKTIGKTEADLNAMFVAAARL